MADHILSEIITQGDAVNNIIDPKQAGERLLQYAREGRLVQGKWHADRHGREVACLLGAAAGITDAKQCPASLMPPWVANALPELFDGQTKEHAQTFARRWGEAMIRSEWKQIDWDAVRAQWMAFVVSQSKDAAARYAAAAADALPFFAAAAAAATVAAHAAAARYAAAAAAARDLQADALMDAIERAMEVARGCERHPGCPVAEALH
jgi:hypothetical protein